ncbi:hypothetical protein IJ596_06015 [bacterium]|nr:hypothetical protein [bacterium]
MGFAETMRIMSGINCGLASGVSYIEQRNNGVNRGYALTNLFGNVANGLARNEAAYEMQKWGNPMGNIINSFAGYGNPVSNTIGTLGIMSALTPWMFFNMPGCYMMPWGSSISYSHHVSYSF